MKTILLTKDQKTIVDDKDFEELSKYKWYAKWEKKRSVFYAARNIVLPDGRRRIQLMHRLILGLQHGDGKQIDHENHDTLDNRRDNIKIVTNRQNNANHRYHLKHGVGIKLRKGCFTRPFEAWACVEGKYQYIGLFSTKEEAQKIRKKWLEEKNLV